jgi:antitoxin MazE
MKVNLVPIGNSKGVRIPRSVIDQCGLGDEIEMLVRDGTIVLAPARGPRAGWDEAFETMAAAGDDALLLPEHLEHEWDEEAWAW